MSNNGETADYEILFHSDGTYSVKFALDSPESAIEARIIFGEIERNLKAIDAISEIRLVCKEEDGLLIFPKTRGVSDEIRLVACAAAAFPGGFPQNAIKTILRIADSSRDAYLNWETKESSRYIRYDATSKLVYISPEGIVWVHAKLRAKNVEGFD